MEQKLIEILSKMEAALPKAFEVVGKGAEIAWAATLEVYRVGAIEHTIKWAAVAALTVYLWKLLAKLLVKRDEEEAVFLGFLSVAVAVLTIISVAHFNVYAIVGMFKPELLVAKEVLDVVMWAK
jgi:hypothetical protein